MKARMVLATLFVVAAGAVALPAASAGVRMWSGKEEKADGWAAMDALRNLSDVQEQDLRNIIMTMVEKTTREMLVRLQQALDDEDDDDADSVVAASAPAKRSMGDSTTIDAESIRRFLKEGIPSRGIPPLDPFTLSDVTLNISIPDIIDLQANIQDLSFNGLSSFQEDGDIDIYVIETALDALIPVDVLIPRLRLITHYKADASLDFGFGIWGDGSINLVLNYLRVKVNLYVKGSQWYHDPVVSPCEIEVKSRGIQMEIEGLFGSGLLSQLVGEIITDELNDALEDVLNLITNTIQGGMCGWLSSKTTSELIGLFTRVTSMPLQYPTI